jgi:hypothetical protein
MASKPILLMVKPVWVVVQFGVGTVGASAACANADEAEKANAMAAPATVAILRVCLERDPATNIVIPKFLKKESAANAAAVPKLDQPRQARKQKKARSQAVKPEFRMMYHSGNIAARRAVFLAIMPAALFVAL